MEASKVPKCLFSFELAIENLDFVTNIDTSRFARFSVSFEFLQFPRVLVASELSASEQRQLSLGRGKSCYFVFEQAALEEELEGPASLLLLLNGEGGEELASCRLELPTDLPTPPSDVLREGRGTAILHQPSGTSVGSVALRFRLILVSGGSGGGVQRLITRLSQTEGTQTRAPSRSDGAVQTQETKTSQEGSQTQSMDTREAQTSPVQLSPAESSASLPSKSSSRSKSSSGRSRSSSSASSSASSIRSKSSSRRSSATTKGSSPLVPTLQGVGEDQHLPLNNVNVSVRSRSTIDTRESPQNRQSPKPASKPRALSDEDILRLFDILLKKKSEPREENFDNLSEQGKNKFSPNTAYPPQVLIPSRVQARYERERVAALGPASVWSSPLSYNLFSRVYAERRRSTHQRETKASALRYAVAPLMPTPARIPLHLPTRPKRRAKPMRGTADRVVERADAETTYDEAEDYVRTHADQAVQAPEPALKAGQAYGCSQTDGGGGTAEWLQLAAAHSTPAGFYAQHHARNLAQKREQEMKRSFSTPQNTELKPRAGDGEILSTSIRLPVSDAADRRRLSLASSRISNSGIRPRASSGPLARQTSLDHTPKVPLGKPLPRLESVAESNSTVNEYEQDFVPESPSSSSSQPITEIKIDLGQKMVPLKRGERVASESESAETISSASILKIEGTRGVNRDSTSSAEEMESERHSSIPRQTILSNIPANKPLTNTSPEFPAVKRAISPVSAYLAKLRSKEASKPARLPSVHTESLSSYVPSDESPPFT